MKEKNDYTTINFILIGALALLLIANQVQLLGMSGMSTSVQKVGASVIPTGMPRIYGNELGISYDDINPNDQRRADVAIEVMANMDRTMELQGDDLSRYIKVASQISCEYCCGAQSIIFSNGQAACGCAHSYAMRGLAKYLIKNHGNEFSDDEVLSELGKWKTLFFPGIMQGKADIMKQQGIDVNYISLGSNMYRGIEQGNSGSGPMVGGC